jgi:hypothetical protein
MYDDKQAVLLVRGNSGFKEVLIAYRRTRFSTSRAD